MDKPSQIQPKISTFLLPLVNSKWANVGAKQNIEIE